MLAHVSDCLTVYSLMQWGPTIYQVSTQNPSESFECFCIKVDEHSIMLATRKSSKERA